MSEEAEEESNVWVEEARRLLDMPREKLIRRQSGSHNEERSVGFQKFAAGGGNEEEEESPQEGAGEAEQEPTSIRVGSARPWGAAAEQYDENDLKNFLNEHGVSLQRMSSDAVNEDDDVGDVALEDEDSELMEAMQRVAQDDEGIVDHEPSGEGETQQGWLNNSFDSSEGFDQQGFTDMRQTVRQKRVVGGVISTYKGKKEMSEVLERRAALLYIQTSRESVQNKEAVLKEAEGRVASKKQNIAEMNSKINLMREECAKLDAEDHFGNLNKVKTIESKVQSLERRREDELQSLQREEDIEYVARTEFNRAQIQLRKVEEVEQDLVEEENLHNEELRVAAGMRAEKELRAAMRLGQRRQGRKIAAAEQQIRNMEKTNIAIECAKAGRVAALRRVREARAQQAAAERQFEEKQEKDHLRRAEALLELKGSMESAFDKIRGANEKQRKRMRVIAAKRAAEKSEILAAGGNPYAVWRQQDHALQKEQEKRKRDQQAKEQETRLLKQLMEEESRRQEKEVHERRHKAVLKQFQAEMGGQATQDRVIEYMRTRTVGSVDVLDPTGRETRVYPSKATVLMDWKFGLGIKPHPQGAQPGEEVPPGFPRGYEEEDPAAVQEEGWRVTQKSRLIDNVQERYPEETFNATLVGSKALEDTLRARTVRSTSKEDVDLVRKLDELDQTSGLAGEEKGGKGSSQEVGQEEEKKEEFAVPEFQGIWDSSKSVGVDRERRWGNGLSKLEQQYLKEAMERKKAGHGWIEKQVVWGREFKGTAFVPSEKGRDISAVEFVDFEPGKTYRKKITLTNASFAFNTFKLLELPDSIKDFFAISYSHPGSLSPGMTCDLVVKFEPKINEDVDEVLPLLCQTGPQDIPLRCYTKKVNVSTLTPEIELDAVLGEVVHGEIVLVNKGALPCPMRIRQLRTRPREDFLAEDLARAEEEDDYEERESSISYEEEAVVSGYSTTKIRITLTPQQPSSKQILLHLCFQKGLSKPQSNDIVVAVQANVHDVPIYVEEEVIDLRCCCFDVVYSQVLQVRNRGKVALKALPAVPPALRNFVKFSPDMAYVQARSKEGADGLFNFQMKFEPSRALLQHGSDFVIEGPTGKQDTFAFPLTVSVPDQKLPVNFELRVQLTDAGVQLDKQELDFGECSTSDAVSIPLSVHNPSELPTRIGFLSLPRGLTVRPDMGLCSLLPGETRTLQVEFAPFTDAELDVRIVCSTSSNKKYPIRCRGRGVKNPLKLSCSNFVLRPCSFGDRVSESLSLANVSSSEQTWEVVVPRASGLKISPLVAKLQPGRSLRVQLDFSPPCPPPKVLELLKSSKKGKRAAREEGEEEGEQEGEEEGEKEGEEEEEKDALEGEGGIDGTKAEKKEEDEGNEMLEALNDAEKKIRNALLIDQMRSMEGEEWSRHETWQLPIFIKNGPVSFLQVQTSSVSPMIVARLNDALLAPQLSPDGSESLPVVDFGKLPVGQEKILTVKVSNLLDVGTSLSVKALDPFGAFFLLKAPSFLRPKSSQMISFAFRPKKEAAYNEQLVISSSANRIRCLLTGWGVSPTFEMQGLPAESGIIDAGDVLVGSDQELPFTLKNNSPFEVSFCVLLRSVGEANSSGVQPFDCIPSEASIPADSEKQLKLLFIPDVESQHFVANFKINVPNQKESLEWRVIGRSWRHAMYIIDESYASAHSTSVNRFKDQDEMKTETLQLEHTFPQNVAQNKETSEHSFIVGNCGVKGAGEFVLTDTKEAESLGFTFDQPAGKVDAGARVSILVKYSPPPSSPLSMWNEVTVSGALKGGDPPPPGGSLPFQLRLRGFVAAD